MGRNSIKIASLHGYNIDQLVDMKNKHTSSYARTILTAVIMRYNKCSTKAIMEFTNKSNATIVRYITLWNNDGIKCLDDHRGGSEATFSAEMEEDLINTTLHKTPNDCGFLGHSWTLELLSKYIENNYGSKYSIEWIRHLLKRNNLSYKRAIPKPTLALKEEQETFKKNVKNTTFFRIFE